MRMPGAVWIGPVPYNSGDGDRVAMEAADALRSYRGIVVHIAAGTDTGTIAWQKNDDSNVSSHFIVSKEGLIYQLVDTHDRGWTQRDGNDDWLAIENEGTLPNPLTPAQVSANARILAWGHKAHEIPLQLASSPTGRGLGHHSMGAENGYDWGHSACPGPAIKAQKPAILAQAQTIAQEATDMRPFMLIRYKGKSNVFALFGNGSTRWIGPAEFYDHAAAGLIVKETTAVDEIQRIANATQQLPYNWPLHEVPTPSAPAETEPAV